ncbi:exodeoxyribonuclease VII small subunit [Candidatus Saccharibacteria bacterium]|jgi:exodeoxyribonuclease VII small subunit|nr:exodeoxyribonuclease VII small subunit [Candidatus Saccharibacteria bacterium]MBR2989674.1 exodeoxyribonuclease VII small subunit [Candidatus Saccharibacteria bacterium]
MPKNEKNSKKKLSEKMSELEKMVDWFYSDEFSLDDAEEKYRKAMELSAEIENDLDNLENKIEVINRDFSDGASI